jgi:hypothetical protein
LFESSLNTSTSRHTFTPQVHCLGDECVFAYSVRYSSLERHLSLCVFSILLQFFSLSSTIQYFIVLSGTFQYATCRRYKPQTKKATQNKPCPAAFSNCCSTTAEKLLPIRHTRLIVESAQPPAQRKRSDRQQLATILEQHADVFSGGFALRLRNTLNRVINT